jgi:hypothetical protein
MASNSEAEEILEAAVAGIPRVAQAIAETPAEHRSKALEAAERSYRQTLQELGYEEGPAQSWFSAVMLRLHLLAMRQRRHHRKSACTDNVCMRAISVEQVFRAVNNVLLVSMHNPA